MRILLSGATGFLGSHLLGALIREGHDVCIIKRSSSDTGRINMWAGCFRSVDIDKTDSNSVVSAFAPDVIIHCATTYGRDGRFPEAVWESNLFFPLRLMAAAERNGCKYFINTDTFFCKQLPERLLQGTAIYMPDYTLSKYQFREWGKLRADEGKTHFINLQMEHIYGPGDAPGKFIPWISERLKENVPYVELTDGTQVRDFVPVEVAVKAYIKVLRDLNAYAGFSTFDIGTGKAVTLRAFVEKLKEELHSETELRFGALPKNEAEIAFSSAPPDNLFVEA